MVYCWNRPRTPNAKSAPSKKTNSHGAKRQNLFIRLTPQHRASVTIVATRTAKPKKVLKDFRLSGAVQVHRLAPVRPFLTGRTSTKLSGKYPSRPLPEAPANAA